MNDALVTCDISYRLSPTAASTYLKDIENICDEKYGIFRDDRYHESRFVNVKTELCRLSVRKDKLLVCLTVFY